MAKDPRRYPNFPSCLKEKSPKECTDTELDRALKYFSSRFDKGSGHLGTRDRENYKLVTTEINARRSEEREKSILWLMKIITGLTFFNVILVLISIREPLMEFFDSWVN